MYALYQGMSAKNGDEAERGGDQARMGGDFGKGKVGLRRIVHSAADVQFRRVVVLSFFGLTPMPTTTLRCNSPTFVQSCGVKGRIGQRQSTDLRLPWTPDLSFNQQKPGLITCSTGSFDTGSPRRDALIEAHDEA